MKAQTGWMWLLVVFTSLCLSLFSDCSFALPLGTKANPTQEEIDNITSADVKEWMIKYKMAKSGQIVNLTNEISKIQRRAGIKITGELNNATKRLFLIPRCGVPESEDADQEHSAKRRKKRFTLQGSSWLKKDLTYRFLTNTADLPEDVQRDVLRRMINKWAEVSTLTIREAEPSIGDDDVDILISFVRRYHNDPYAFDGEGGTLAHAYYPHNNRGLSGDAHFDDDEYFTTRTPEGINLDWVAVHEFGHSMGLEHSSVRESIMYPWYKGYFENIELTDDDIKGIQALYGAPTPTTARTTTTEAPTTQAPTTTKATTTEAPTTQAPTTTKATTTEAPTTQAPTTTKATTTEALTTQAPTTTKATTTEAPTTQAPTTTKAIITEAPTTKAPTTIKATTTEASTMTKVTAAATPATPFPVLDICKVEKFDAFVMGTDRKTYVFSGHYFWVLGVRLGVESGPTKITSKWKELKTPINSAYTNWDGRTVFFKGNQYWKYSGYRLEEGPRDISRYGLPSDLHDPDAAFIWDGNYKTYFFKGENYWRYNERYKEMDPGYPRHISIWGLPFTINSAMSWSGNRRTYFFRGANYWKLDDGTLTLVGGYPRDITQIWMSCAT